MAGKIIDEDVLKLAVQNLTQLIADNVYEETPYLDSEVDDMFDGTPEDIQFYSSLISDTLVSENRIFSSKHVSDLIQQAVLDSNEYSDDLIKNISSIQLEWCETSLPTTGETNKIYILPVASGSDTVNTLNIWNATTSAYVSIGNLEIDLSQYYTSSQIDTKLADKANSSEVLAIDKVQTTTGSETSDTVYSSQLTKTELNGKVDKTSILTANDTSATDDQVYSAKAMNIELDKKATMDKVGDNIIVTPHTQIGGVYTVKGNELNRLEIDVAKSGYTCIGLLSLQDNHGSYTQFKAWFVENNKVVIYVLAGDTFSNYIILASLLYKKN